MSTGEWLRARPDSKTLTIAAAHASGRTKTPQIRDAEFPQQRIYLHELH